MFQESRHNIKSFQIQIEIVLFMFTYVSSDFEMPSVPYGCEKNENSRKERGGSETIRKKIISGLAFLLTSNNGFYFS